LARPAVDGLERDLAGRAVVVRLNVADEVGRAVAARYGLGAVPTFLAIKDGEPVMRLVGQPDKDRLMRALLGQ